MTVQIDQFGVSSSLVQTYRSGANDATAVTPNDSADLPKGATRGLYIGYAGDVKVDMTDGTTVTFVGLASGIIHPISVKRVYAGGTTAQSILAVY